MNDELRQRVQDVDPMPPGVPVESMAAPAARQRLERIMNTPLVDRSSTETPTGPTPDTPGPARSPLWRRPSLLVAAAAVTAVAGAAAFVAGTTGGDEPEQSAPLELSLGESSSMASCLPFDVGILAGLSPAFAATATDVAGDTVTLTVDRWYAGGDAAQVQLHATPGAQALLDGFEFEVGRQYLITAADSTVNFCGFSGPATPELTAAFEQAFGR